MFFRRPEKNTTPPAVSELPANQPRTLHGFTIQPISDDLLEILRVIESPILRQKPIFEKYFLRQKFAITAGQKKSLVDWFKNTIKAEVVVSLTDEIEAIFCFVNSPSRLWKLLVDGREVFRQAALAEIGKLQMSQVYELGQAVGDHFGKSYLTLKK